MSASPKYELTREQFDAVARAIADPRRFAIFRQIAGDPGMFCSALEAHQQVSAPTISHHLKELHEAGLIEIDREGRSAHLSVRRDVWESYLSRLAKL